MNKNYFISVVVPAYNEEKYITPCLESLRAQDYPKDKFEIIVETSGSTDKTALIANKFGAQVINNETKAGVSASRDNGARAASGEIIAQTDADSVVPQNWLTIINEDFQDEQVVGVTGLSIFTKTNWFYKVLSRYGYPIFAKILFSLGKTAFIGMNFAIRKETYQKIGGFNRKLNSAEDADLGIRAGKVGKIIFDNRLLVYTSPRRIEKNFFLFFGHHLANIVNFLVFKKTNKFENIR